MVDQNGYTYFTIICLKVFEGSKPGSVKVSSKESFCLCVEAASQDAGQRQTKFSILSSSALALRSKLDTPTSHVHAHK